MERQGEEQTVSTERVHIKSSKSTPAALDTTVEIINHLAEGGRLEFFMYALPGEPHQELPDDVWLALRKLADNLRGLYIEVVATHWVSAFTLFGTSVSLK